MKQMSVENSLEIVTVIGATKHYSLNVARRFGSLKIEILRIEIMENRRLSQF